MDDARFQEELRRFWDEIARGGPATPGDLDPEFAATIRRLHAMRDVPPPNPAYAKRLRESLMDATSVPVPFDLSQNPIANGLTAPRIGWTLPSVRPAPRTHRGRLVGSLATAALLLVTLVASLVAFGPLRPKPEARLPMMAAVATPSPGQPGCVPLAEPGRSRSRPARPGPSGDGSPGEHLGHRRPQQPVPDFLTRR